MTKVDFEDKAWIRGHLLFAIAVLMILVPIVSSCQIEKRTPEEIAKIDSLTVKLAEAPATSVVKFKDGDLDIIERSNEEWTYFILNTGRQDKFRTKATVYLATKIEEIFPPSDPCHSIMVQNAVDKLAAFQVDADTVGVRECPQAAD